MPTDHRTQLASIRRFDQLVAYLRDALDWPIESDNFEDLTFEYTPEEIGIDVQNAAKIQEIKRLRPLEASQPWGIFFVKFEPKRLPVVALRRILGQFALKKRASANKADRQAWAADDLLFISSYGEAGDDRCIAFAHFSKPQAGEDLPTLKVLGWDNLDTPLHLDDVAHKLTEHLSWPDEDDPAAWRERWRGAFTLRHRQVITTSKELSIRLAELARAIRDRIKAALSIETDKGPLTQLMKAFQTALVHDLDADGFADMYAQTISYGLLSARIADPHKKTADDLAAHMRTNPFLRELMETFLKVGGRQGKAGGPGIDFDELGVSEVVELLDDANMEAVVRDFGDQNPEEDPVIHFYELFLKEYDARKRMQRGVFYTPRPVVSYIVRSVDELLRTEFGLADGLADTTTWAEMAKRHQNLKIPKGVSPDHDFVQILDPATGTGTFLVEVIGVIHKTLAAKWKKQGHDEKKIDALWNEYVPKHLLPRLHGYELLMAPYAIAHLKIGLKLYETGYRFGSEERARVFLTNALEPPGDGQHVLDFLPALAHEAQAVNAVKRHARFTVVVGNPPYSNFGQLNKGAFILQLLEDYKRGLNERKLNLDDDFIKFLRFAQFVLESSGTGVLGMITNSTFLDGVNHRRMREMLLRTFQTAYFVNLHGNTKRKETPPPDLCNENVFDIMQGVGISLLTRAARATVAAVRYFDAWGTRDQKHQLLARSICCIEGSITLQPTPDRFFLVAKDFSHGEEYESWPSLRTIFPLHSLGIETSRDDFAVAFDKDVIAERVRDLCSGVTDAAIRLQYNLEDKRDWTLTEARRRIKKTSDALRMIRFVQYRPFDARYLCYSDTIVTWPRHEVLDNLLQKNIALISVRNSREDSTSNFYCTAHIADKAVISSRDNATVFPLYKYPGGARSLLGQAAGHFAPNLSKDFLKLLTDNLGIPAAGGRLHSNLTPEDIFHYIYAVFHSPNYRSRYAEFLKIDFPRLPLTGSLELFRALAKLGGELVALHLLENPQLAKPTTTFMGGSNTEVEKVSWSNNTVWLDKKQATGFKGVREEVWDFHIGGYQVCNKWLKDRKGRTLSPDDIAHYQKIVVALSETIRLMKEIDEVIEKHGGWPGAFHQGESA